MLSFPVAAACATGMAVSHDGAWLAVSFHSEHVIRMYATTPPHTLLRTIGSRGADDGQLNAPCRICFTPTGNLLVCYCDNNRVQELKLDGKHVRSFAVPFPYSLALCGDVLAVGTLYSLYVRLLSYPSGAPLRDFESTESGDGRITGMRFTLDGRFLVVAENTNPRLSVFTVDGEFVCHIGAGLSKGWKDVAIDANCDVIVAEYGNHLMCVFPFDVGVKSKTWGNKGTADEKFEFPRALALVGERLFMLNNYIHNHVQVFE